jgi:hypothetical protein
MHRRLPMPCLLLIPLLLAGCRPPGNAPVPIAPGAQLWLCPPQDAPDLFATQEVRFLLPGGRQETVLVVLENRDGNLSLVASTPMGQTLFVVRVRDLDPGVGAGVQAAVDVRVPLPAGLDPRTLAALVQFALWPDAAVARSLGPGLSLRRDAAGRSLLRAGRVVWSVTWDGEAPPYRTLELRNPAMDLDLKIRTVPE